MPTFDDLAKIEPKLPSLYDFVADGTLTCFDCQLGGWPRVQLFLVRLVGWNAENPALRSSEAYDVAQRALLDLMPPCDETCGHSDPGEPEWHDDEEEDVYDEWGCHG